MTTSSRYESSSRNVTSPRNYSVSPTPRHDSTSPINYVPAFTHRIASPINIQRVSSPITTITQRVTSPVGESYKLTERSSSYKTSNYVTSDEIRGSPSYATAKRATSPGECLSNQFIQLRNNTNPLINNNNFIVVFQTPSTTRLMSVYPD